MISIIIIGYNSKRYLDDCLSGIFKSSYKNFRVIFVDNCSNDDSARYIKKNFPKVILIENNENSGFAKGNNIGIKEAFKLSSDYMFLLNPDTIIDEDCLKQFIKFANKRTILQPLILIHNETKTSLVNTTGGVLNYMGFSYCSDYKSERESVNTNKKLLISSGAAMFVPKEIFQKVGLFDEKFFMYNEDTDLSFRSIIFGFDIIFIKEAVVWHKYKFARNNNKLFLSERNRFLFLLKNFSIKTLFLIFPVFLINELLICAFSLKEGWIFSKFNSYIQIILLLPYAIKMHIFTQKNRVRSDKKIKSFLTPILSFSEVRIPQQDIYNKFISWYWNLIYKLI